MNIVLIRGRSYTYIFAANVEAQNKIDRIKMNFFIVFSFIKWFTRDAFAFQVVDNSATPTPQNRPFKIKFL